MDAKLTCPELNDRPVDLSCLIREAEEYVKQSRSNRTVIAYRHNWREFTGWCEAHGFAILPTSPEATALYLTEMARTLKVSSLAQRLAAIAEAHRAAGMESPTSHTAVRLVWSGIRRSKGVVQQGKSPVLTETIRAMIDALPDNRLGQRDRALLLLGFNTALRRFAPVPPVTAHPNGRL